MKRRAQISSTDAEKRCRGLRCAVLLSATMLPVSCGDDTVEPKNGPPVAIGAIPAQTVVVGDSTAVDVSGYFSDPDGETLTFRAESSATDIVGVSVAGSIVTGKGVSQGTATVRVTAQDPGGLSAGHSFNMTVPNRVPEAVGTMAARELEVDSAVVVDVSQYFTDPDGDTLQYSAASSDTTRVAVGTVGSTVTATAVAAGSAIVTVTARDPGGLAVKQDFGVAVPNRAPMVEDSLPPLYLVAGGRTTVDVSDLFSDPDNDSLTFTAATSDAGVAIVTVEVNTAIVTAVAKGETAMTVTAHDPGGLSAKQSSEVSVTPNPDRAALVALYEATLGRGWTNSTNWLTGTPMGDWFGVYTDSLGRVTQLSLQSNALRGPIPSELGNLTTLQGLYLIGNGLTGSIPPELGNLANLISLSLWDNALTGSIPPELGKLASLTNLSLGGNELTGSIPPELGNLTRLERLSFRSNALTGSIPPELGNLANLISLSLWDNALTGSIPPELGKLASLTNLSLDGNELTATIPPELGNLARLERLSLYGNELTGTIPPELGNLASLEHLHVGGNALSGAIPPHLGNLARLAYMSLSGNTLAGSIPPELGKLTTLASLFLTGNAMTGSIPPELRQLERLSHMYFANNDGLCAPGTADFVEWVEGMEAHQGPYCNESDRMLLESLYQATDGPDWSRTDGWLGSPALATWYGVATDSLGRVESLDLGGNGLSGQLPFNIGGLGRMTDLLISDNALGGRLPSSLARLALKTLHYTGSDLCAPSDPDFQAWLKTIGSHEGTGVECAPLSERDILVALFDATGGPGWADNTNWRSDTPIRLWHGVEVDSAGSVTQLSLARNNLVGPIPPRLGDLANLEGLSLPNNALAGLIPPELGKLANLRSLQLHDNDLQGRIPLELANLANLRALSIGDNALTGSIPSELGNLGSLEELSLWVNKLAGSIPPELGKLTSLRSLQLASNDLTGSIPSELSDLANLRTLSLWSNKLSGPIPPELGELARLEALYLRNNKLSGLVPPKLGKLANLRALSVGDNALTGTIPLELGNLTSLKELSLSGNRLSGSIPPELGKLIGLWRLRLDNNDLTGSIPMELGNLASIEALFLAANRLNGSIPPELGNLASVRQMSLVGNDLSGPLPPDLGDLTNLTWLEVSHNGGLAGPLPASLVRLGQLERLMASGTHLCSPRDEEFQTWLLGIRYLRLGRCEHQAVAYLSQAVQSRDFPVPLVAGDGALLRVFLTAAQANEAPIPPVRATFFRGGVQSYIVDIASKPGPIPTTVQEGGLWTSANARIPGHVVQPGLEMVIDVDPARTLDPTLALPRRIPEAGRTELDVQRMPVLDLTIIPFMWTEAPDSAIVGLVGRMVQDPHHHELLDDARVLLPVGALDLKAHEPVWTSTNNGYQLLSETEAIRILEGNRGHYMGMMSGPTSGRVAGVAYRQGRSSFSRPQAPTIAHELGHNMSLRHAPCGDPSSVDGSFPYPDGSIGAWGYDSEAYELVAPTRPDLMSYCGRRWISDYHFGNALRYRLFDEGVPPRQSSRPEQVVLLWGGKDVEGKPFLFPTFVADASPALPDSAGDYRLTGRTTQGRELFSISFSMPEVVDAEGASSFVFALPVQPGWERDLTSITLDGPAARVTLNQDTDRPMAILRDPRTGRVRGILRDVTLPAMTLENLGDLGGEPNLEVLFSRGIPDDTAWRGR